ncbi:threonine--tRNA ligase [Candidatus Woesearchaeota archaeon]|nr:threonine--tRNA ligase [Candidatus Woesearchaeota archaeon]
MDLDKIRHSASHILAYAVRKIYPDVKLGMGPAIEDGFYYDFDNLSIKEEDLTKIEEAMKAIIKGNHKFNFKRITRKEAQSLFRDQEYKLELLKDLKDDEISIYQSGDFIDLCKGPHVNSTSEIRSFKLLRIAGAYWKGNSNNKMLTRIYGTAFDSEKELRKYMNMLEEAEKRNHIKLGKELELFTINELVGKGLPIWLPRGQFIRNKIENFAVEIEDKNGYLRVTTPHIAKKELFIKSGHLPHYENTMYPKMKMDDGEYYLKAMNCPFHHLVFNHTVRSYRDMPVKIAEYGTVYRNELSGVLTGLLRVRMLSMNDAHIYCTREQIPEEIKNIINMIDEYYKIFRLKDYYFRLSLWDQNNKTKYINEPENWKYTEDELRNVLKKLKVKFVEAKDEAAFYGPKIDIQFKNVYGREETVSTIQLDFATKTRFNLRYFDSNGNQNNDVFVIHRAPLSCHERFIAFLIENYSGKFPLWLNPLQIKILTISENNIKYAQEIKKKLEENNFIVELDDRDESIGKKIVDAHKLYPNYMIIIGDKEVKSKTIAVRDRTNKTKFNVKLDKFTKDLLKEIKEKR